MNFITNHDNKTELTILQEYFLRAGIQLSDKDYFKLLKHQSFILQQLQLVELDSAKLLQIISPFLSSSYMHEGNYMNICKKVISSYYAIRSKLDWHSDDKDIIICLCEEYVKSYGEDTEMLSERTMKKLIKEGGIIRNERFNSFLQ